MPRTRNPYPAEFREQIVALARAGRSVESLAREFEPCAATIHGWVKQAGIDQGGRSDGLTSDEREVRRYPRHLFFAQQKPIIHRSLLFNRTL